MATTIEATVADRSMVDLFDEAIRTWEPDAAVLPLSDRLRRDLARHLAVTYTEALDRGEGFA